MKRGIRVGGIGAAAVVLDACGVVQEPDDSVQQQVRAVEFLPAVEAVAKVPVLSWSPE
ncbi:MAG: hypothetical protein FWD57_12620 [Polyangiaceae bacterium]|nr:hypothetical protein [Polyangiaceae bacterium]